jgi:hypothetical protein
MLRRLVLSLAIVVWVCGGVFAAIPGKIQMQDYVIGATIGIDLLHGHQTGQGSHTIAINNNQAVSNICGAWATQSQAALLNQVGSAQGDCAVASVGQIFDAFGGQTQAVGECINPILQGQEFGLLGDQLVAKSEGAGSGSAYHMLGGNQSQVAGNPIGTMLESAATGAFQNSLLTGGPGATGTVISSMAVDTLQAQSID